MRVVAGLLAMLLMVGCSDKDNVPSGILSRDKMEKVLWDMVQADQYSSLYLLKDSARINVKTETQKLYEEVFRLHDISREDFRKSYQYYQEHPDLTRSVFDSLLARGNRLRTESYSRPSLSSKPPVTAPVNPPVSTPAPGLSKPPGIFRPPVTATPGNPATKAKSPAMTPGKPLAIPGKPVTIPGKPVTIPGKSVTISGRPGTTPKDTGMRPKPAATTLKKTAGPHHPSVTDTVKGKQPQR